MSASLSPEEAIPYLSESLLKFVSGLVSTISGYVNVFLDRGDHDSCQAILRWGIEVLDGLREADKPNYLDKIRAVMLAVLAGSQFLSKQSDEAHDTLIKAKELAAFFDAAPSYDESDVRFVGRIEGASAHDDMGATAAEAVDRAINEFEDEGFTALWRTVNEG